VAQIFCINRQFDRKRNCTCRARRSQETFFAQEVSELKEQHPHARILRLEDLQSGAWSEQFSADQRWDLIYSSDMLSTLPTAAARQIVKATATRLMPGGRILMANLAAGREPGTTCTCGSEAHSYRTESEMAALTRLLSDKEFQGQAIFRDDSQKIVYLELCRRSDLSADQAVEAA
jgi:hypothetical protein